MILTDEEKRMRDGAEGAATAAAMDLLIRYGDALACDRLCDVRNVAGTMTQPSPVKERLVREGGWDKAFAVINLDCDTDIEVPAMRVPTCQLQHGFGADARGIVPYPLKNIELQAEAESFYGDHAGGPHTGGRVRRRQTARVGRLRPGAAAGRLRDPQLPGQPNRRGLRAARPDGGARLAEGEALVSPEPISGWGGIDPAAGRIIEPRHVLNGVGFTGKVLVFPSAKGSSGWSAFFQSTRLLGTAPIAMVITRISTKSALGAVVTRVPAVTDLDRDPCQVIRTGDWVASMPTQTPTAWSKCSASPGATPPTPRPRQKEAEGKCRCAATSSRGRRDVFYEDQLASVQQLIVPRHYTRVALLEENCGSVCLANQGSVQKLASQYGFQLVSINWAVTSAGTLDETTVMQKLQHLDINTLGIVWARSPANYENISQVLAAMEVIAPDGTVTLYNG